MRDASATRFGADGIEAAEITVNVIGDTVYLSIQGEKKLQQWCMPLAEWNKLLEVEKHERDHQ